MKRPDPRLYLGYLPYLASLAIVALAAWTLHGVLREISWADVSASFLATPVQALLLSFVFTAVGRALVAGYDVAAFRAIGYAVPLKVPAMGAFEASSMSQLIGFAALTGSALRLRAYGKAGVPVGRTGDVIILSGLAFVLGLSGAAGAALLLAPQDMAQSFALPPLLTLALGGVLAFILAGYFLQRKLMPGPLTLFRWSIALPDVRWSAVLLVLGVADIFVSAAALWVLLPDSSSLSFIAFGGIFAIVVVAGLLAHVPGAVGVLESGLLLAMPQVSHHGLLAAILMYRVIYYLTPAAIAAMLIAAEEFRPAAAAWLDRLWARFPILRDLVPTVIAGLVFVGGVILLVSGATPAIGSRMEILRGIVPLPFIELSHLTGSVAGFFLVVLSNGLFKRLNAAWTVSVITLLAGVIVSLMKGLDWEEALVLVSVLALTLASRSAFYRKSSLFHDRPSTLAVAAIGLACLASLWVVILAYQQVDYSNSLWWEVAYAADAPRSLRSSLVVLLLAGGLALHLLLSPRYRRQVPDAISEPVRRILATAQGTSANLALTGDKSFLVANEGDAFIMYAKSGKNWIVMGDPVGNPEHFSNLAWQLKEQADEVGARLIFYEVKTDHLPLYLDLGLIPFKIGEEAIIDLTTFSLEGGARANLRQSARKAEKQGMHFRVVPREEVAALLPDLRAISDAWLRDKGASEKGFSVGFFDDTYLQSGSIAVVEHEGRIIAFANIWSSGAAAPIRHELSVDLMRHRSDAPAGLMDFLFVRLLLWGKEQGYQRFNLGMAPLSGLTPRRLSPFWHKAGNLIYSHGEQFYGFEGLRAFKDKFRPAWEPRYVICPNGLSAAFALISISRLIARGPAQSREFPRIPAPLPAH